MQLPFFYIASIQPGNSDIVLDEDNSRHAVSVLRMQAGAALHLTDGKGHLLTATIIDPHKKRCRLAVSTVLVSPAPARKTAIGISLVKNAVRFEWFLEKAAEIGINEIFPLLCNRTEKQHFRADRMHNVLVSALLQSRQTWLPVLHPPLKFDLMLAADTYGQKFIAHCMETDKKNLHPQIIDATKNQLVLIGPEGDFTEGEIGLALEQGCIPVSLGTTRLRTETAGLFAAVVLQNAFP
ncbi:MAG: RsmE family RNA methyltransferase [Chitinophagaceae bacterium]